MNSVVQLQHRRSVVLIEHNALLERVLKQYLGGYQLIDFSTYKTNKVLTSQEVPVFIIDQDSASAVPYGAIKSVHNSLPDAKVIVLGRSFSGAEIFSLLLEGVTGFVTYDKVPQELRRAVETVGRPALWCTTEGLQEACLHMQSVWRSKRNGCFRFTERQKEIIDLVSRKLTNKQIALHLSISENTVKFHLAKVFRKLGTRNRDSLSQLLRSAG